jgi:hypothetical protein
MGSEFNPLVRAFKMIWRAPVEKAVRSFYHYSGLRFVVWKFTGKPKRDSDFEQPPSGVLWLIGLYVAAFGISYELYMRAISTASVMAANYEPPAESNEYCSAMYRYRRMTPVMPVRPEFYSPVRVFYSLFGEDVRSADLLLTDAREVERYAWWLVFNAAQNVKNLQEGDVQVKGDGLRFSQGLELKLDRRYQVGRISYYRDEAKIEVKIGPGHEPSWLSGLLDARDIYKACFYEYLGPVTQVSEQRTIDCTSMILQRACEETRPEQDVDDIRNRYELQHIRE